MEITNEARRRILKAFQVEHSRVDSLRMRMLIASKAPAKRKAESFVDHGVRPTPPTLPPYPKFPPECVEMVCGGRGRRLGRPCQRTDLYANGRCKWHGGLSTGLKTRAGKIKSLANLLRGSKL